MGSDFADTRNRSPPAVHSVTCPNERAKDRCHGRNRDNRDPHPCRMQRRLVALCSQTFSPVPWPDLSRLRAICLKEPAGTALSFAIANKLRRAGPPLKQVTKSQRLVSSRLVSAPQRPFPAKGFRLQQARLRVDRLRVKLLRLAMSNLVVSSDLFQDNERLRVRSMDPVPGHTVRDWWESCRCAAVAVNPACPTPQKLSCR